MNELVINVVSRFNILDSPWPDNDSCKDGSIKEFLLTVESSGFDVSQYIEYFHIKKANDMENKEVKKTVNQDNDIVCIMKKWLSSYKGDSEYPGNAIPLYSGTELYIKKEYIEMLEKQFGTLMMKTCVESYTQNY